ncbi:MAG: hypothetical protein MHMPM18_001155 [Marteilia pararefringens]
MNFIKRKQILNQRDLRELIVRDNELSERCNFRNQNEKASSDKRQTKSATRITGSEFKLKTTENFEVQEIEELIYE